MKERRCLCCFHHRPTVPRCHTPNTSCRRCQGWRRCGYLRQKPQPRFGPCRGQSLWMKGLALPPHCPHHRPTVRRSRAPSTSGRRCQGWRRCVYALQRPQRPFVPCRGQSLWTKVRRCRCRFHHRPTVHGHHHPNTSSRRCRELRRCGHFQLTPQWPFGPHRDRLHLLGEKLCTLNTSGLSHRHPTALRHPIPNTSVGRCQG